MCAALLLMRAQNLTNKLDFCGDAGHLQSTHHRAEREWQSTCWLCKGVRCYSIWTWPAGTNQWGQQWAKWGGGGRSSVVLDLVAFIKIPLTTCLTQFQFPSWMVLTSFWHGKTPAGPNVERSNLPLKWYLPELFRRAFAPKLCDWWNNGATGPQTQVPNLRCSIKQNHT